MYTGGPGLEPIDGPNVLVEGTIFHEVYIYKKPVKTVRIVHKGFRIGAPSRHIHEPDAIIPELHLKTVWMKKHLNRSQNWVEFIYERNPQTSQTSENLEKYHRLQPVMTLNLTKLKETTSVNKGYSMIELQKYHDWLIGCGSDPIYAHGGVGRSALRKGLAVLAKEHPTKIRLEL
jgi:hypothetical protein